MNRVPEMHPASENSVVHIAGPALRHGINVRQRCAWCGVNLSSVVLDASRTTSDRFVDNDGFEMWRLVRATPTPGGEGACALSALGPGRRAELPLDACVYAAPDIVGDVVADVA